MALQSVYMLAPVAYVQVRLPEQTNTDSRKSMPFCNQNGIFRCLMLSFRLFIKKVGRIIVYQNISAKYFWFFVNSWGNPKNEIKIFNKRQKIKLSLVFLIDRQTYVKYDCENA